MRERISGEQMAEYVAPDGAKIFPAWLLQIGRAYGAGNVVLAVPTACPQPPFGGDRFRDKTEGRSGRCF